jgi:hypothetical protein
MAVLHWEYNSDIDILCLPITVNVKHKSNNDQSKRVIQ